ncbi:MAG: UDP-N-acetylglucosamine 2-epimerase, partial [Chloroflexota bacterium]|nr:UDP-N-acetylglucosamine 2-epimerase [Chloroflexota bacterium]
QPAIILVLGDRVEPLAAVIAASIMNIPVAHLGGGQSTGGIDNSIRHAITKFAHIHLARTPLHAKRLQQLGEEEWRIHTVGNVCLDTILNSKPIPQSDIAAKYSLDLSKPIILVVFHSDTLDIESSIAQARNLCEAIVELNEQTIFIYPNTDAGGREILGLIKETANHPNIQIHANIPQSDYYGIMRIADILIGNSSSGSTEAPAFKLPVVTIGDRQKGRDRFENSLAVTSEKKQIMKTVKMILTDDEYREKLRNCSEMYGDGKTGERIAQILAEIAITSELTRKNDKLLMDS